MLPQGPTACRNAGGWEFADGPTGNESGLAAGECTDPTDRGPIGPGAWVSSALAR